MTNLVLAAMAAALVASFRSFPIAFAAGVAIGIGQTELTDYVDTPGVSQLAAVRGDHPRAWSSAARRCRSATTSCRSCPAVGTAGSSWWQVAIGVGARGRADRRGADELAGLDGHDVRHRHRPAVGRRRHRLRRSALARAVRARRLRRVGRRPPRRRAGWPFLAGAASSARVAAVPLGRALRPAGGPRPRHQPGDRHARARHRARADGVQQRRPRPAASAAPSSASRRCSAWRSRPTRYPVRYALVCLGFFVAARADGRQHAPRPQRPATARGAHQRAGRGRARHQRRRAPRSTRSRCPPASPPSAARCSRSARTRSSTAPSSPTSRRSPRSAGRSSAASAT